MMVIEFDSELNFLTSSLRGEVERILVAKELLWRLGSEAAHGSSAKAKAKAKAIKIALDKARVDRS